MASPEELRGRARATWAAGDWDRFARLIAEVGALVVERAEIEPGTELLDVGTGTGGNVAIPAARAGAKVVGLDVTPELLELAHAHAAEAGVEVEWIEGDAAALPFGDTSFDRVISTFGAMFAPDHASAAAELVRVCRPGGRVLMTTWINDGFVGEMFSLAGEFLPPPPPGVEPPPLWGVESHVREMFGAAGVSASIAREAVAFDFPSVEDVVNEYGSSFGPFVMARRTLEPEGRWDEFLERFGALVRRFNRSGDERAQVESRYFLITVDR
jgi:SAM-dependent methyltransferase